MPDTHSRYCAICWKPLPYGSRHRRAKASDGEFATVCLSHHPDEVKKFVLCGDPWRDNLEDKLSFGEASSFQIDTYKRVVMTM